MRLLGFAVDLPPSTVWMLALIACAVLATVLVALAHLTSWASPSDVAAIIRAFSP